MDLLIFIIGLAVTIVVGSGITFSIIVNNRSLEAEEQREEIASGPTPKS